MATNEVSRNRFGKQTGGYNSGRVNGVDAVDNLTIDDYLKLQRYDEDGLKIGDKGYAVGSLQSDLTMLGFKPGSVDWIYGQMVSSGVKAFQEANNLEATGVADPRTLRVLAAAVLGFDLDAYRESLPPSKFAFVPTDSKYFLDPELVRRMHLDPQVAKFVQYTMEKSLEANPPLDPVLMANQFWTESRFDPMAGSGKGACGIAQFIPSTGAMYGLKGKDFFDPYKSMAAGIAHMSDLTAKYGDQRLALYGYNGGGGCLEFAREQGVSPLTYNSVREFFLERRMEKGETSRSAWHVETLDYDFKIVSDNWPMGKRVASLQNLAGDHASPAEVLARAGKDVINSQPVKAPLPVASETGSSVVGEASEPVVKKPEVVAEVPKHVASKELLEAPSKDSASLPSEIKNLFVKLMLRNPSIALSGEQNLVTQDGRMRASYEMVMALKEHYKNDPQMIAALSSVDDLTLASIVHAAAEMQNKPDRMNYAFDFYQLSEQDFRRELWANAQGILEQWNAVDRDDWDNVAKKYYKAAAKTEDRTLVKGFDSATSPRFRADSHISLTGDGPKTNVDDTPNSRFN